MRFDRGLSGEVDVRLGQRPVCGRCRPWASSPQCERVGEIADQPGLGAGRVAINVKQRGDLGLDLGEGFRAVAQPQSSIETSRRRNLDPAEIFVSSRKFEHRIAHLTTARGVIRAMKPMSDSGEPGAKE